jgi:hypothetical protein
MAVAEPTPAVRPRASLEGALGRRAAPSWGTATEPPERVKLRAAAGLGVVSPTEALRGLRLIASLEAALGGRYGGRHGLV